MTKWINTKGWLKGYVSEKEKSSIQEGVPHLQETKSTVAYVPLKCPRCRSRKVHCYGAKERPVLYYKCLDCKFKFKVLEVEG